MQIAFQFVRYHEYILNYLQKSYALTSLQNNDILPFREHFL